MEEPPGGGPLPGAPRTGRRPSSLVMDVSSLEVLARLGTARPSGIERLQLELVAALLRRADRLTAEGQAWLRFTRLDPAGGRYVAVDRAEVARWVDRIREGSAPAGHPAPPARESAGRRARRAIRRTLTGALRSRPDAAAALDRSLARLGDAVADGRTVVREVFRPSSAPVGDCDSASWGHGALYWSVGVDHVHNDLDLLAGRAAEHGFSVALVVHDLIAVVRPDLVGVDLTAFYDATIRVADRLLAVSECTADDLERFADERSLALPPTDRLRPVSGLADVDARRPAGLAGHEPFALTVGTVEIRKNHALLLDVWEGLVAHPPPGGVPRLVVAGREGWLAEPTWQRLRRSPVLRDVVLWLPDATDPELAWLYRHARVTLFPSLYEGWGVPVTESLDAGTPCLSADTSSLPEAGEGLTELLDPFDRAAWRAAIVRAMTDDAWAAEARRRIAHQHVRTTPDATLDATLTWLGLPATVD